MFDRYLNMKDLTIFNNFFKNEPASIIISGLTSRVLIALAISIILFLTAFWSIGLI